MATTEEDGWPCAVSPFLLFSPGPARTFGCETCEIGMFSDFGA